MGIVNDYIKKLLKKFKENIDNEKPWLQYYGDMNEHLSYFNGSIYDFVADTASRNEEKIAYKFYGAEATYKKYMKKIDKIASALMQFKIVPNECVTICMPNTPESIALIYAVNKIGAIANIVHPLSSTQDIERALKEANSSILFCSDVSMPRAKDIKVKHFIMIPTSESLTGLKKIIYNAKFAFNMKLTENQMTWGDFLFNSTNEDVYVKKKVTDPAAIIYSGGTTGKPKGIIISNLNFNAMAQQTASVCKYIRPGYSVLAALPIFHVFGLSVCIHTCLAAGMTLIILPKLNTKKMGKELKKYKPNIFPAVPSLVKMVINGEDPGKNAFK